MLQHVADNVGVVEALGEKTAIVVGHDWGSPIAAHSALLRPDVFTAVALLSVAYSPPGRRRPTESFAAMAAASGEEFYINYFQEPGRAEAEIELDVRSWLLGFYFSASGDSGPPADGGTMATVPPGKHDARPLRPPRGAALTGSPRTTWTSTRRSSSAPGSGARSTATATWTGTGWTSRAWRGSPINVPALFVGGEKDGPTIWGAGAIARYPETLPRLRGSHILPGCGHWIQQERPDELNELLTGFLQSL